MQPRRHEDAKKTNVGFFFVFSCLRGMFLSPEISGFCVDRRRQQRIIIQVTGFENMFESYAD